MRKDTRIIIAICIILVFGAGVLFVKQQESVSGAAGELISAKEQVVSSGGGNAAETDMPDSAQSRTDETVGECAVYVSGAVKHPGLYRYQGTARVSDAIEAVGGFLKSADREAVNLARKLNDGEQICVLTKKETAKKNKNPAQTSAASTSKEQESSRININNASLDELMALPGIGEAKAGLIIDYRNEQGAFSKPEDLMKISGIKEGVYNKIRDLICV